MFKKTLLKFTAFTGLMTASMLPQHASAFEGEGEVVPMKGEVKVETLERGKGWSLSMLHPTDGSAPVEAYILNGLNGIMNAPIPESERSSLLEDLRADEGTLDPKTGEVVKGEGVYVIHRAAMEEEASTDGKRLGRPWQDEEEPSPYACNAWNDGAWNFANLSYNNTFNQQWSTGPGTFSGSVSVTVPLSANFNGTLNYRYKRTKAVLGCFPYLFKFRSVVLAGSASSNPIQMNATGTVSVGTNYSKKYEIMNPSLGSVSFWVGYVPVYIPFSLPVESDINITANASGTVSLNATAAVQGSVNVTCTDTGCSSSAGLSASFTPPNANNSTLSLNGRANLTPGLYAAVRASVYDPYVFFAQVGPRAYTPADFWGYSGNACGDADGNGTPEYVNAITLDLDWGVQGKFRYGSLTFGTSDATFANTTGNIKFWDLLSSAGGSSALRPMISGASSVTRNVSSTYNFRMRPCYPYSTAQTTYQVNWGDGSSNTVSGAANTNAPKAHTWTTSGSKTISATADFDNQARDFNHTTTRSITVN